MLLYSSGLSQYFGVYRSAVKSPTFSDASNPNADDIVKLRVSKKIELTLLFGVGFLLVSHGKPICILRTHLTDGPPSACIITAIRIITVNNLKNGNLDYTIAAGFDALWTTLEPDLGIILACVPVMQPVQRKFKGYLYGLASRFKGRSDRSLRSSSVKISDEKPPKRPTTVSRLYPLSSYDRTVDGTDSGTSLEQFDVERGHR